MTDNYNVSKEGHQTDWRGLLQELVQSLDERAWGITSPPSWAEVKAARAALAQPEPEDDVALLRAALKATAEQRRAEDDARSRPAAAQRGGGAVSNKRPLTRMDQLLNLPGWSWVKYAPWEQHDGYCDKQGRCWFRREIDQSWYLERPDKACNAIACLPHYALPLPQGEVE